LGLYLFPDLSLAKLAAAALAGVAVAAGGAWLLLRYPYLIAYLTLACIPLRLRVDVGSEKANLLVPLYAVVAAFAASLLWQLLRGDSRTRELGPVAWPLGAVVMWTGLSLVWSLDVRKGSIFLAAFVLPFGLLAIGFARLPWRGRRLVWLGVGLVGTALAYAAVGAYQWVTRDVFWNPSVIVANAYAPFFRVNSVFWDPSVYGRYLTIALLALVVTILYADGLGWRAAGLYGLVVAIWCGLLLSFSQSSFLALAVGVAVAAEAVLGRRALAALSVVAVLGLTVAFGVPDVRDELRGKSTAGINRITSGRSNLVAQGARIALEHPVLGVGVGGFGDEYARRLGVKGDDPKRVASHTTVVTVAAETGLPGLALFGWLIVAALSATLLRLGRGFTSRVSLAVGVALVAIAVHSCFYAAFFEDPTTWALLGLVGLAARMPRKEPAEVRDAAPGAARTMLAR
jgi:O-antigen ligase